MTIKQAIQALLDKRDLSYAQMRAVMLDIMGGGATEAQVAGFLVALRCKGETVDEIAAAAEVMRALSTAVPVAGDHVLDTCGTGGDGAHTFNISTTAAFVAAAAGAQVAKHGNRSVSGRCGSADVLEAAGVNLDLSADQVAASVRQIGIGFLFAPRLHGAMRHVQAPRRQLGVRTLFNLLGPLTNPASAPNQLIGVYAQQWLEPVAQVAKRLGGRHVLVVCADDGLDEISLAAATTVVELKDGALRRYRLSPGQFGLAPADLARLAVADVAASLAVLRSVLANHPGPARDIVCLNAGAAIYAANLAASLADGVRRAQQVLASGAAAAKLEALVAFSNNI